MAKCLWRRVLLLHAVIFLFSARGDSDDRGDSGQAEIKAVKMLVKCEILFNRQLADAVGRDRLGRASLGVGIWAAFP
jgi:hypothetical protein